MRSQLIRTWPSRAAATLATAFPAQAAAGLILKRYGQMAMTPNNVGRKIKMHSYMLDEHLQRAVSTTDSDSSQAASGVGALPDRLTAAALVVATLTDSRPKCCIGWDSAVQR